MYSKSDNSLPPNNEIFLALKAIKELNPYIKKIMPFVQAIKESVSLHRADALGISLPFDEKVVLSASKKYLAGTLEVSLYLCAVKYSYWSVQFLVLCLCVATCNR